jgi:hypothetical protein
VLALARRASEGLIAEGGRRAGQAGAERGHYGRIEEAATARGEGAGGGMWEGREAI